MPLYGGKEGVKPGVVASFAAASAPDGWLKSNGAALSTTTYSALFAVIGYTYGGAGAYFNLPDLRGEFVRGLDDARNVDSGRTIGSAQADNYKSHSHAVTNLLGYNGGGALAGTGAGGYVYQQGVISNSGGTETRPRNVALLTCIKY